MTATKLGYKNILVATDFSPASVTSLKLAVWLTRQFGSKLVLAHTLPDLHLAVHAASYKARIDLLSGDGEIFEREIRQNSDSRLRQTIADMNAIDINVKYETLLGEAFVEITHAVQQEGYDLVLAGTRGHTKWDELFVGSTAKRLIRKCPASVWIVKAEHADPPKVVLSPTDFSDVSRKAVLEGLWVAEKANAEFHLLHVINSSDFPETIGSASAQSNSNRQEVNERATRRLDEFIGTLGIDTNLIRSHLSFGTPWKEIQHMVHILKVDLIAMGTVGRSGIQGLFLGNTAERVLATCDCSILTTKPDGFVSPIDPALWPLHPGPKHNAPA